ncbi:MAG: hypothetical protein ABI467_10610 [Kofleriaceae bacterium]
MMIGYRTGTGDSTQAALAHVANAPKPHTLDTLRDVLAATAVAPLTIAVDGIALVPTGVRAKVGLEPGGARPMVVVLVTYALPRGHTLSIISRDPHNTRISWQDRASHRVVLARAPAQDHWHDGVASFLLKLAPGAPACATPLTTQLSAQP